MIPSIGQWYRTQMLEPDGRVLWWEHATAFGLITTPVGLLFSAHILYSAYPYLLSLALGTLLGTWSWRQDRLLNADRTERDSSVPLAVRVYGLLYACTIPVALWSLRRYIRLPDELHWLINS